MTGGQGHEVEGRADVDVDPLTRTRGRRLPADGSEMHDAVRLPHEGLDNLRVLQVRGVEADPGQGRERVEPRRADDVGGNDLEPAGAAQQLDDVRAQEAGGAGDDDRLPAHAAIRSNTAASP